MRLTQPPPKISIILPVYQFTTYLAACLESIWVQTERNWELIIVNDASSTESLKKIESLISSRKQESSIRLLGLPTHVGLPEALNKGLTLATGELVARMDADDIMAPDRLRAQSQFLNEHPAVDFCGGWQRSFSNDQEQLVGSQNSKLSLTKTPEKNSAIQAALLLYDPILHPTVMWRRAWQDQHWPIYRAKYSPAEDYDAWLRAAPTTIFAAIPQVLHFYRCHEGQVSCRQADAQAKQTARLKQDAQLRFLKKHPQAAAILHSSLPKTIKVRLLQRFVTPQTLLRKTQVLKRCTT